MSWGKNHILCIGRLFTEFNASLSILFSLCKCLMRGMLTSFNMKSLMSLYKNNIPNPTNIPITSPYKKAINGLVSSIYSPFWLN